MIKIFKMNSCDWVAAENVEDAKKCLADTVNDGKTGPEFEEEFIDCPQEVTDFEMNKLKFTGERYDDEDDLDENGQPKEKKDPDLTFRQELNRRIEASEKFPQFFASTEF